MAKAAWIGAAAPRNARHHGTNASNPGWPAFPLHRRTPATLLLAAWRARRFHTRRGAQY